MNDLPLVEAALHATYQLSPTGSGRLRRLTAASGLNSENVLSRVAIVLSLKNPAPVDPRFPTPGSKGKEIKGTVLLGRAGPASLLVAMILLRHDGERTQIADLRALIIGHWERGLDLLNRDSGGGSVVDLVALRLQQKSPEISPRAEPEAARERPGGHGDSPRDRVAASLGREFGRMPIEVRRLLAMVGRFEVSASREAALKLMAQVLEEDHSSRVSESRALRVIGKWGLNRLGMASQDRALMKAVLGAPNGLALSPADLEPGTFLEALGLVTQTTTVDGITRFLPSTAAKNLGEGSWLQ